MNKQDISSIYRGQKNITKSCTEMAGICKGLIADGQINQAEAEYLYNWLQANPEMAENFPGNIVATRLAGMLEDGRLDEEESAELLEMLRDLTGEKGQCGKGAATTSLAYDTPQPKLDIEGQTFCLTGTFLSGERANISAQLENMGAIVVKHVTKIKPCCLVVGTLVTEAWKYSTHGRKLEAAVQYRDSGCPVCIISEDHLWNEIERNGFA